MLASSFFASLLLLSSAATASPFRQYRRDDECDTSSIVVTSTTTVIQGQPSGAATKPVAAAQKALNETLIELPVQPPANNSLGQTRPGTSQRPSSGGESGKLVLPVAISDDERGQGSTGSNSGQSNPSNIDSGSSNGGHIRFSNSKTHLPSVAGQPVSANDNPGGFVGNEDSTRDSKSVSGNRKTGVLPSNSLTGGSSDRDDRTSTGNTPEEIIRLESERDRGNSHNAGSDIAPARGPHSPTNPGVGVAAGGSSAPGSSPSNDNSSRPSRPMVEVPAPAPAVDQPQPGTQNARPVQQPSTKPSSGNSEAQEPPMGERPSSPSPVTRPNNNTIMAPKAPSSSGTPAEGMFRNGLYFTNWGIYGNDHQPQDFPGEKVTHLLYAFGDIKTDGEVIGSDSFADVEKRYDTDSASESGNNAYGCVKQLFIQKKKNRQLKLLLSIGGWTLSPKFAPVAASAERRRRFATSAAQLMGDWGFDGLDIDWEYPKDATEAANFVSLLTACRQALDEYAEKHAPGYHFALTVAVAAGEGNYKKLDVKDMAPLVDIWFFMAYDYAGSWDDTTGHQANVFKSEDNPASTKFDTETAVSYYISQGVDSRNILLGLPLYGRTFAGTEGLGKPYEEIGKGSVEKGVYQYKDLPLSGSQEMFDDDIIASWSYDGKTKELVTYDTVRAVTEKTSYLVDKNLGGAFFWESSGDRQDEKSLVRTVAKELGQLDTAQNLLKYPGSKYDNIKNGMPGE